MKQEGVCSYGITGSCSLRYHGKSECRQGNSVKCPLDPVTGKPRQSNYACFKRDVALTLSQCLFGHRSRPRLRSESKQQVKDLMREFDLICKGHGVDWKLDES